MDRLSPIRLLASVNKPVGSHPHSSAYTPSRSQQGCVSLCLFSEVTSLLSQGRSQSLRTHVVRSDPLGIQAHPHLEVLKVTTSAKSPLPCDVFTGSRDGGMDICRGHYPAYQSPSDPRSHIHSTRKLHVPPSRGPPKSQPATASTQNPKPDLNRTIFRPPNLIL